MCYYYKGLPDLELEDERPESVRVQGGCFVVLEAGGGKGEFSYHSRSGGGRVERAVACCSADSGGCTCSDGASGVGGRFGVAVCCLHVGGLGGSAGVLGDGGRFGMAAGGLGGSDGALGEGGEDVALEGPVVTNKIFPGVFVVVFFRVGVLSTFFCLPFPVTFGFLLGGIPSAASLFLATFLFLVG